MKILLVVLLAFSLLHFFGNKTMVIGKDTITMGDTITATSSTIGPGRPATKPPEGYLPLEPSENTPTIGKIAHDLLVGNFGDMTPFTITSPDGNVKRYMARVDAHYHAPPPKGTPPEAQKKYPKPWGWHKGVTVYKADPAKSTIEDYVPEKPENGRTQFLQRIDQFYEQLGMKPN